MTYRSLSLAKWQPYGFVPVTPVATSNDSPVLLAVSKSHAVLSSYRRTTSAPASSVYMYKPSDAKVTSRTLVSSVGTKLVV